MSPAQETKLEKLDGLWWAGRYAEAIEFATTLPRLGMHKEVIKRAHAAYRHPEFYVRMNKDPLLIYRLGLVALAERYDLPRAREDPISLDKSVSEMKGTQ